MNFIKKKKKTARVSRFRQFTHIVIVIIVNTNDNNSYGPVTKRTRIRGDFVVI